jgi:hypothetical protein
MKKRPGEVIGALGRGAYFALRPRIKIMGPLHQPTVRRSNLSLRAQRASTSPGDDATANQADGRG